MTTPTTDLGTTTLNLGTFPHQTGNMAYQLIRHRWRQKKPFNLILPYLRQEGICLLQDPGSGGGSYFFGPSATPFNPFPSFDPLKNLSYERLKNGLYETAELGVDFAEYRQSVGMIVSTVGALGKAAYQIKHLRFGDAANTLRMKFAPKGVSLRKSFANNWLEFHFGWTPLLGDIHDACEVLNDPLKCFTFQKGTAKAPFTWSRHVDFGSGYEDSSAAGILYVKQGARVKAVTSAGLHSLEQFGIINPLSLAWEIVPFSFVVDWFVNVGDYLHSFSDFSGMTLDSTFTSMTYKIKAIGKYTVKPQYNLPYPRRWEVQYNRTERYTTLSGITFGVKKLKPPSLTRAATAISLLLQQMKV